MTREQLRLLALTGARLHKANLLAALDEVNKALGELEKGTGKRRSATKITKRRSNKPHWTQTASGRRRMATIQRKAWQTRKARQKE